MAAFFCDSSAIVKRYIDETGSDWLTAIAGPKDNTVYVARTTFVEVVSAVTRREKGGHISTIGAENARLQFEQDYLKEFQKVEISESLIREAAKFAIKYALRGYDAVQLAAVLESENARVRVGLSSLVLLSADTDLNTAAISEGLTVDDPNDHP
ncbi:MAG: type II toxin-antitoxin system VapC family toxin [Pyrinomonadaceae bacterium]